MKNEYICKNERHTKLRESTGATSRTLYTVCFNFLINANINILSIYPNVCNSAVNCKQVIQTVTPVDHRM